MSTRGDPGGEEVGDGAIAVDSGPHRDLRAHPDDHRPQDAPEEVPHDRLEDRLDDRLEDRLLVAGPLRRRATLSFEDGARAIGPAHDVRTPSPSGLTPDPFGPSTSTASGLTSESTSILFDGQAAGYRLGRRLPGSDDVYQAAHPRFEGRLVIKLFRRARGLDPRVVERFLSDTSRTSSLRHPHVVQVVDAGVLRDGTPFVVAEFLTGRTLETALEEREGLISSGVLALVRGMASALTAAHSVGVVHRELRPDNIFIAELDGYKIGFSKLMDFGVCHLDAAVEPPRARAGTHRSGAEGPWSQWYLAPEQWQPTGTATGTATATATATESLSDDPRTDQFALAAIAYRLLSPGRPPARRTETGAVEGPLALVPRVPALETVLGKAMSVNPAARFESVATFFRAFEESVSGATILAQLGSEADAPPTATRSAATRSAATVSSATTAVLPTDDAVFPPAASPSPTPRLPSKVAPPRRQGNKTGERTSLTQQFFVEGERQEATRFKNAQFERQPSSNSLAFDSFDNVPRRRTPLLAALFIVGALAVVGLVIWPGTRLRGSLTGSALARRFGVLQPPSGDPVAVPRAAAPSPPAAASEAQPEPLQAEPNQAALPPSAGAAAVPEGQAVLGAEVPATPSPGTAAGTTEATAGSAPAPTASPGVATELAPEPPVGAPTTEPPAPPPTAEARLPIVVAPLVVPSGAARLTGVAGSAAASRSSGNAAPAPPSRAKARSTALRGYVWSPQLQQMVPAQPAWPPPAESPPSGSTGTPASPSWPASPTAAPPPFRPEEPNTPGPGPGSAPSP